jgi:hypothetical protein
VSILDNAKQIAEAVHEIHNLELYQRVLALHSDVVALVEQNIGLRNEITELRKASSLADKMKFRPPFFYQDDPTVPYCPACFDTHKRAAHLIMTADADGYWRWDCPSCKQNYFVDKPGVRSHPHKERPTFIDEGWMAR